MESLFRKERTHTRDFPVSLPVHARDYCHVLIVILVMGFTCSVFRDLLIQDRCIDIPFALCPLFSQSPPSLSLSQPLAACLRQLPEAPSYTMAANHEPHVHVSCCSWSSRATAKEDTCLVAAAPRALPPAIHCNGTGGSVRVGDGPSRGVSPAVAAPWRSARK